MARYNARNKYLLDPNWVKQDYDTSCALNCLQQSFYALDKRIVKESTMYGLGYTGKNGTGHDGIEAIVKWYNKKYGTNHKVKWYNLSDLKGKWKTIGKALINKNKAVFFHIGYHNGGVSMNGVAHGHYEILSIINTDTKYVQALNSLSGGYIQDRKLSIQEAYMKEISQPSICTIYR